MPIRPELRPLYPPHWRELSSHVRFERAGGRCQRCGRPHLALLRCLPDGRWFDEQAATWRDRVDVLPVGLTLSMQLGSR